MDTYHHDTFEFLTLAFQLCMKTLTIVIAGTATLITSALTYALYFDYKRRNDPVFRKKISKSSFTLVKSKKEERETELAGKPELSASTGKSEEPEGEPFIPQDEADLSVMEILQRPGEERQKIFYKLLIKGEELLKVGPQYEEAAIKYFYKAMKLVPAASELILAFQKTLPDAVFKRLLEVIKNGEMERIMDYFTTLGINSKGISFQKSSEDDTDGEVAKWSIFSSSSLNAGQEIFTDSPVTSMIANIADIKDFCYHCQNKLTEVFSVCESCSERYCSETCHNLADDQYHMFICPGNDESHPFQKIVEYCKQHDSTFLLFLSKYLALMLSEEKKGNSQANGGPFLHFEFLKTGSANLNGREDQEVQLVRALFQNVNEGMIEFLSSARFNSLKSTLQHNLIGFGSHTITTSKHIVRGPSDSIVGYGLFHLTSHIAHSCDPNAEVTLSEGNCVSIKSLRAIPANEQLSISYIPCEGKTFGARQLLLKEKYNVQCTCSICEAEVIAKK